MLCVCVCTLICLHLYEVLNYPQDARKTANADVSCLFVVRSFVYAVAAVIFPLYVAPSFPVIIPLYPPPPCNHSLLLFSLSLMQRIK